MRTTTKHIKRITLDGYNLKTPKPLLPVIYEKVLTVHFHHVDLFRISISEPDPPAGVRLF